MCRCPDYNGASFYAPPWRPAGSAGVDDDKGLRIRSFQLRLAAPTTQSPSADPLLLPGTITLVYFPGGAVQALQINGSKVRPGAPAFLSLYRVQSSQKGAAVFACTDRVWAAEQTRFEAYVGEEKAVSGVLRRREGEWEMECRCGVSCGGVLCGVEVTVVGERGVVLREEIELPKPKVRRSRRCERKGRFCSKLEGIPEEEGESEDGQELGEGDNSSEAESCECSCCGAGEDWEMVSSGSQGSSEAQEEVEAEIEGVRWAVDVGIWVMCIGVGLLVSKASTAYPLNRRWRQKGFLFR